jgi:hypothetical protein
LQELGRALALDPQNPEALATLMEALSALPEQIPLEVAERVEASIAAQRRATAFNSFIGYASTVLFLPLFLWLGLRRPGELLAIYGLFGAASALSFWVARRPRPSYRMLCVILVISDAAFALLSRMHGALILGPSLISSNTIAFAVHMDRRQRLVPIILGSLAFLLPLLLEGAGVIDATYRVDAGALIAAAHLIGVRDGVTIPAIAFCTLAAIVTGAIAVGRLHDLLLRAEQRNQLMLWQLEQLAPDAALGSVRTAAVDE